MKVSIKDLTEVPGVSKLIVNSLEQSLYQAMVEVAGKEYILCDNNGDFIRGRSLLEVLKQCQHVRARARVLRQESAYDEMVGAPPKSETRLEVPISDLGLY